MLTVTKQIKEYVTKSLRDQSIFFFLFMKKFHYLTDICNLYIGKIMEIKKKVFQYNLTKQG